MVQRVALPSARDGMRINDFTRALAGRSSVVTAEIICDHDVRLYGIPLGGEKATRAVLVVGR